MDVIKEIDDFDKQLTRREFELKHSVLAKDEQHVYPYKNTCKKAVGEYFATTEDKLNVIKYMSTHPTVPATDREYILKHLP
jgi:hypothetical protein